MVFSKLIQVVAIIAVFCIGCTKIEYTNQLDVKGIYGNDLNSNPKFLADEDNDSIPNVVDPDWSERPRDENPPTLNLNGGDTVNILLNDTKRVLQTFLDTKNGSLISATDKECGKNVTISVIENTVDIFKEMTTSPYHITYKAIDCSGNSTVRTRYVKVVLEIPKDITPPSLVLVGDSVVEISLGGKFDDPGAIAYDLGDSKNVSVTSSGTVDVNKEGSYTITYSAKDSQGNSTSIKRIVNVRKITGGDNDPPKIVLKGSDTITLAQGQTIDQFKLTFKEPGYTATDVPDGDITKNVKVSEITFQNAAYYYIQYDVKDAAGNSAQTMYRYIKTGEKIEDKFPPVIILVYGDSTLSVIKGTKWVEPGFAVTDVQDKNIPTSKVKVDSSNLVKNLNVLGNYVVTYTVTNSVGLTTVKERKVDVVLSINDREPPVITLLGRNPDTVLVQSTSYKDPGYTATDDRDGDVTAGVSRSGEVNLKKIGKNTLSYSVSDLAGNKSKLTTRTVWVVFDTLTTDILVRYNVPSQDPLPSMSGTWVVENIDGEGPDLSNLKNISIQWDLTRKTVDSFQFNYVGAPHNLAFNSVKQTFASANPSVTFTGTQITGMDKTYYVTMMDAKFVWVEQKGTFAIIFKKSALP